MAYRLVACVCSWCWSLGWCKCYKLNLNGAVDTNKWFSFHIRAKRSLNKVISSPDGMKNYDAVGSDISVWTVSIEYLIQVGSSEKIWPICQVYTGCPGTNVPDFGRIFLKLKYTNITQNTYIQSWTVTELMTREVWKYGSCYTLIDYQIHIKTGRNMWFL